MSIGMTPQAKRVLELAESEAVRLGHNYVGTEHLLLGLIVEDNVAVGTLEALGVDRAKVQPTIDYIMGRSEKP